MSLIEFNEAFASNKVDPLADRHVIDFDWAQVFANLDGDRGPTLDDERAEALDAARARARVLLNIFRDIIHTSTRDPRTDPALDMGRRFVSIAWGLCPKLFNGATLDDVCKRFDIEPRRVKRIAADARQRFQASRPGHPSPRVCDPQSDPGGNAPTIAQDAPKARESTANHSTANDAAERILSATRGAPVGVAA